MQATREKSEAELKGYPHITQGTSRIAKRYFSRSYNLDNWNRGEILRRKTGVPTNFAAVAIKFDCCTVILWRRNKFAAPATFYPYKHQSVSLRKSLDNFKNGFYRRYCSTTLRSIRSADPDVPQAEYLLLFLQPMERLSLTGFHLCNRRISIVISVILT